jgi:hypothetical protein
MMNFRRARKILHRLGLAIVTTATIATASQATPLTHIITTNDNRPHLAIFGSTRESYAIGCPDLEQFWRGTERINVPALYYDRIIKAKSSALAADLPCAANIYKGYTSSAIPGGHMLIVIHKDGRPYRHYVTPDFFRALKVTPQQLSKQDGERILTQFPLISSTEFKSIVNENTTPTPAPKLSVPFLVPNRILTTTAGNYPPMAMFDGRDESYIFDPACPGMNALWGTIRREGVSSEQFGKVLTSPNFVGGLACNVPPGFNQGYSSPDIPGGHMLILRHRDGIRYRHFVNTPDFFGALQLTPKQLSPQELETILKEVPPAKTHFTKSS